MRVMTVCTGNICRSPMAQVVLRARFDEAGLDDVVVHSTGVSDEEEGNAIDRRARRVLLTHGYPGGDEHRARQVRPADLREADLVVAMTHAHARALRRLAERTDSALVGRIALYRSFDPSVTSELVGGKGRTSSDLKEGALDIADPWYGGMAEFEVALAQIEAGADGIVRHLTSGPGRTGS